MKLRNVNPIGHVDVPLLYRQGEPFDQEGIGCLQPGEVFDCTEQQARRLLPQTSNYEPADGEAQQLRDQMAEEARRKAEAVLALAEANAAGDRRRAAEAVGQARAALAEVERAAAAGTASTETGQDGSTPAADTSTTTTTDGGAA